MFPKLNNARTVGGKGIGKGLARNRDGRGEERCYDQECALKIWNQIPEKSKIDDRAAGGGPVRKSLISVRLKNGKNWLLVWRAPCLHGPKRILALYGITKADSSGQVRPKTGVRQMRDLREDELTFVYGAAGAGRKKKKKKAKKGSNSNSRSAASRSGASRS